MIKSIVLTLLFQDGYLGGHTTAAYFATREQCQKFGEQVAMQYIGYGHPTTFLCAKVPTPPKTTSGKAASNPYLPPKQEYKMPTGVTP
ncbi:hypothetical protein ACO0K2_04390 [Undibacterium sp. MH2W]|uniref:hypothetical protein n=1 Tax=Undibacterium sp. MH2W TaxID=3413044 RepID=UPI003BF2AF15